MLINAMVAMRQVHQVNVTCQEENNSNAELLAVANAIKK